MLATADIGKADKGRHTTTGREMFLSPMGGVLIDTTGMRELGAESADLGKTFDDIERLVSQCKFHDCTHTNEPGCAVLEALAEGTLDARWFQNYCKLKTEAGYDGLNAKEIEVKKLERMFKDVGGMKKIAMSALKTAFESLGYTNVRTYINSGNVLFDSNVASEETLIVQIKDKIATAFALDIPVAVISQWALSKALAHAPAWWDAPSDTAMRHQAIFLIPPVTAEDIFAAVGQANPDYEQVAFHNQVIFWSAPMTTFSKTRWSKLSKTTVYNHVTIRNANTAKKLLDLAIV